MRAMGARLKVVNENALDGLTESDSSQFILNWEKVTVKGIRTSQKQNTLHHMFGLCATKHSEKFKILDNVHGIAKSGSFVAVMGASGCGKTTLLATLSKRTIENVEGEICINYQIVSSKEMINISGFVPQKDVSVTTLTAMEQAYFMSQMKLGHKLESKFQKLKIKSVFSELGLHNLDNTLLSCLSGGERKRLSVAIQLLHDPLILFCDEPTTGLDSFSATILVEKLQKLAKLGKVVLCSIHQPSSDIFDCFDQLIILSSGKLAYHGPKNQAINLFSRLGYSCPTTYNPADFLIMKFASLGEEHERLQTNDQQYLQFIEAFDFKELDDKSHSFLCQTLIEAMNVRQLQHKWHTKMFWLVWRNILDAKRSKLGHCHQAAVFLVTSVVLAVFYMDISFTTQSGIQDVRGLLYLISSEVYFTSAYRVLGTFPEEISIFLREKELYPTTAYYLAKIITMMPRVLLEPTIYLGIICLLQYANGVTAISFVTLLGPLLILSCSASAYVIFSYVTLQINPLVHHLPFTGILFIGCVLSAIFSSPDIASVVSVPLDLISLLMAGMFFNIRSLPWVIKWIKYLSQLHYINEVFTVLLWQHVSVIDCHQNNSLPCLTNGTQVLNIYGYAEENVLSDMIALIIIFVILNAIGCYALYRRSKHSGIY